MAMEINIRREQQGTSTKLAFVIGTTGSNNEKYSDKIDIDGLVLVQIRIQQNVSYPWFIESMIMVQKKSKDCTSSIKVKVFHEDKLCSDRIYNNSENECWMNLGEKQYILDFNDSSRVFLINVTISIIKVESMINEKLYIDAEFTDFRLSTPEGSVAVHRAVLAANSDVFKTMLSQEWKETAEGRLQIEDVTLKTLQHLKQYMYLGTLPDDGLLPLLSIASCYLMETLKTECISKLTQNIKPKDFYSLLECSMENKLPELLFALINETPKNIVQAAQKLSMEKNAHQNPKEE